MMNCAIRDGGGRREMQHDVESIGTRFGQPAEAVRARHDAPPTACGGNGLIRGGAFFLTVLAGLLLLALPGGVQAREAQDRDFPPLVDPARPSQAAPSGVPSSAPPADTPRGIPEEQPEEPYRLGVGDELAVSVLSQPTLSGIVKVRPDGAITTPGAGMVHALGRTPEEVGDEIERKLGAILRHPHVDLQVTNFGEQRIFVMGEIVAPGDKPYYKGISALQAVAQCGGVASTGQAGSVLVMRRVGAAEMELHRLDLRPALKGEGPAKDLVLRPYDIVFVPRSFIADVNLFVDQFIKPMITPFTLYLEGWKAFNIGSENVRVTVSP